MRSSLITTLLIGLGTTACQPAGPPTLSDADRTAIESTSQAFVTAAQANDWAAVAATYTDDAILMPPNAPEVHGRANIQSFLASFPPITAFDIENVEIEGVGEIAWVRGTFSMTLAPEGMDPITDTGKFIEIRHKQADGSWLLYRDMFSSDLPVPE